MKKPANDWTSLLRNYLDKHHHLRTDGRSLLIDRKMFIDRTEHLTEAEVFEFLNELRKTTH